MNFKIILSVVLVVLLIGQSEAQRKNNRRRNRNKKDQCHLREAENCINNIQKLGKGKDPTSIIATAKGLDRICKTIRDDTINCVKTYSKKCGSPLHRELLDLILDQIMGRLTKFCAKDNPDRSDFLKESPCIHKKVLSTEEYKKTCNNNFLAVANQLDTEKVTDEQDSSHSRMCCGYRVWHRCTSKLIEQHCGAEAIKQYDNFMGGLTGTLSNMACPSDLFPIEGDECKKYTIVPGTIAKGKLGENAMTKYVTSLFSFMFIVDDD
jgi:hypothetical protein